MAREHRHTCGRCGQRYTCAWETAIDQDADGRPKVICVAYHRRGMDMCDTCEAHLNGRGLGPNGWAQ